MNNKHGVLKLWTELQEEISGFICILEGAREKWLKGYWHNSSVKWKDQY